MTLAHNKAAREKAGEALELCGEAAAELPDEATERFWEVLRDAVLELAPLPEVPQGRPVEAMSDAQSKAFGCFPMEFGRWQGHRIDETPNDYLEWLADSPDEFKWDLKRYLKSRRIQQESED